jgi:regulator of sigma E protease
MTTFFGSVFWLLVTLGVLVTFHEFGHYWVARRCGVKVLRFSVGFGNAIWKRVARDGTEYRIGTIPLGGYVKMLDAREGDVDPALLGQEFTGKSVWQRIAIVAAGPGFNLIFTIVAFWLMFMLGLPDLAPVVTATPQSIAAKAGIQPGDRILSVDGHEVGTWSDSLDAMTGPLLARAPLSITVVGSNQQVRSVTLPLNQLPGGRSIDQYLDQLGLTIAPAAPVAGELVPDMPAMQGGMQTGDRIVSINGEAVTDYSAFQKLIPLEAAKSPHLKIAVERHGSPLLLSIDARHESIKGQPVNWVIGVNGPEGERVMLRYGPIRAIVASLRETWKGATQTFTMITQMASGRASSKNLSGVINIAQVANASASMGPSWFLHFLAVVSLSLAILNLLPIPVLDGGYLLYYLVELVKGSPVSEQVMVVGQYIGLLLLFTLMGLAFYNDIHRPFLS